jgi:hypothetical protein
MSVHDFSFESDDRAARAITRKPLFCDVQGGSLLRAGHPFLPDLPNDLLGWSCCPTHSIGQGRWRVAPLVVGSSTWRFVVAIKRGKIVLVGLHICGVKSRG